MTKNKNMNTMFDIDALSVITDELEKATRSSPDKWIDNMVGALCDPIVVHGYTWSKDIIPEWLVAQIKTDRLLELMVAKKEGREPIGTESEALAYLMPAGLEFPFDHDWTQIILYLGCKVYEKYRTPNSGVTFPEDIRVEKLDRNQEGDLNRLKRWIYEMKLKHRTGRRREINREIKEEKKREQERVEAEDRNTKPSFFDLDSDT